MFDNIKSKIIQIIISVVLFIVAIVLDRFIELSTVLRVVLYLIPYIVISIDIYVEAFNGIKEGEIFDESFLMCIATIGAMCIGFFPNESPEFLEAILVMLLFQIGELFEIIAENNGEKSINALMEIRPDTANLVQDNGKVKKIDSKNLRLFDIVEINPGEKIPIDGEVVLGKSSLNTVALTGESVPRSVNVGDFVMSGCINVNGVIRVRALKTFEESTASKIIDMVENSNENKASSDRFITKFARVYTPIVILLALIIAFLPPLFTKNYVVWLKRSLSFLVVSCPCALVISIPLSYFGGIGCASKKGILIKGATFLEKLSKINIMAFDKTGTLTKGSFEVVAVHPKKYNEKELLHLAAHVEKNSTHPIASSLKEAYDSYEDLEDSCKIKNIEELSGMGIRANVNNKLIYVGNDKLMDKISIKYDKCNKKGTIIHVASVKEYLGHIIISDKIKEESNDVIEYLNQNKIKTVMLTGDSKKTAEGVAKDLNINDYYYELMPKDKVKTLDKLMQDSNNKSSIAFVGDGMNDAPVLARSDLGISMGGIGSDAAIEAANIVLMDDKLTKIKDAISISKKTERIVKQNIVFILVVKFAVLILAFLGYAPMFLAVFADVGVTILAILNALRCLKM